MKTISLISIIFVCLGAAAQAQDTITGTFTALSYQQVTLVEFDGFNTYTIDRTKANENGFFQISYGEKDYGMGYLEAEDGQAFIVILAPDENLHLEGKRLATPETVEIVSGKQNQLFEQYAGEHPRREQALSAWICLDETRPAFRSMAAKLPFISVSDFRQLESEVVKAYHVFKTPTIYLLASDQEILLRPHSVRQMDAWVEWFLVKGNR